MKIIDIAANKYSRGKEFESFRKRYDGYILDTEPEIFLEHLIKTSDWNYIDRGIRVLGELEITENGIEYKLIDYANEFFIRQINLDFNIAKGEILESIIWVLGDIGTLDTLVFLNNIIESKLGILNDFPNFKHILSALGYSYYHIHKREIRNFIRLINSLNTEPIKSMAEIDAMRRLNPRYADYQQFLLDNFSEYSGGKLN